MRVVMKFAFDYNIATLFYDSTTFAFPQSGDAGTDGGSLYIFS